MFLKTIQQSHSNLNNQLQSNSLLIKFLSPCLVEKNIKEVILSIENKPYLYFGDDYSFMDLRHFCTGYMLCLRDLGITNVHILEEFDKYVAKYYGDYLSLDACGYIIFKSQSNQAAFDKYFELFHSFLESLQ